MVLKHLHKDIPVQTRQQKKPAKRFRGNEGMAGKDKPISAIMQRQVEASVISNANARMTFGNDWWSSQTLNVIQGSGLIDLCFRGVRCCLTAVYPE